MPTSSLIFTIVGAAHVSAQLMRFIEWLDTPPRTKKGPHPDRPTKASRV